MVPTQRALALVQMFCLGALVTGIVAVIYNGQINSWAVTGTAGILLILSTAIRSGNPDEAFFGANRHGLRTLRRSGDIVAGRILGVTSRASNESGDVFVELRMQVSPPVLPQFITTTAHKIPISDVPRYQPGRVIRVRHDERFEGVVTVAADSHEFQEEPQDGSPGEVHEGLREYDGRMPAIRRSGMRTAVAVTGRLAAVALGVAVAIVVVTLK